MHTALNPVPIPARTPALKPLDQALAELLARALPLAGSETVDTMDADGRVLAQDCISALQVPAQDNSAMDGYAVRCADVSATPALLAVTQRIAAGSAGSALQPGSAARIFTGAPLPAGADAVLMQEDCEALATPTQSTTQSITQTPMATPARQAGASADLGHVRIHSVPQPGQWIRQAGEDIGRGAVVLASGTRLTPAALGLAASIGLASLQVARRPRVALFSTGDELVMPGAVAPEQMRAGAVYNSNRFFLRALLLRLGCTVTDYGIVPDQRAATIAALQTASTAHDLILTSGGVSVGEEDHIKPAVEALGALALWQIAIKPGKPFAYGRVGGAHFMGLPGNPVSSFLTFALLVRPFVLRLQGVQQVAPNAVTATARFAWSRPDRRREFLRVRRDAAGGLELFRNQSSGVLSSTTWGDGVVDNPPGQTIAPGDAVRFIAFAELLS